MLGVQVARLNSRPDLVAAMRLTGAGFLCAILVGCAHSALVPDTKPDLQGPLNTLIERVNGLNSALEHLSAENIRSSEALRRELAQQASRAQANEAELRALIEKLKPAPGNDSRYLEFAFHQLEQRLSDQARQIEELQVLLRNAPGHDADALAQMAVALKGFSDGVRQSLVAIEKDLAHEKSYWDQAAPSLLGTFLGALLGLGSSFLMAMGTNRRADRQRRADLAIQIIENFWSPPMKKARGETLGYLEPDNHIDVESDEKRNEIVTMMAFFKYVQELDRRKMLDAELLEASGIIEEGKNFYKSIHSVDLERHPKFRTVAIQAPRLV